MDSLEAQRGLADSDQAMGSPEEENLTWQELARLLGVRVDEDGKIDGQEMFSACLKVLDNDAVQYLLIEQMTRVACSARDALATLLYGLET